MATVSSRGGLATLNPMDNPMLNGFNRGVQSGFAIPMARADLAMKRAQADYYSGRGQYYDQFGNLKQTQADQLVPAQAAAQYGAANRYNGMADTLYPAIAERQKALAEQQIPAQVQSTLAGGPRGMIIQNLQSGKYGGDANPMLAQEAAIGTALQGSTPEVKRNFEYQAANGNPIMQKSIQGANLKATSNQQLLKQQSAFETFDSAVQPMMEDIGNAVSYYSGPGGALRLRGDQLKQVRGGEPSPEYSAYVTALQTQIPLIADNAAKVLGVSRSDASQLMLEQMVGPGREATISEIAQMNPQIVRDKLSSFSQYLQREAQTGRNFVGPLSMDPATEKKLNGDLAGIQSTMGNQEAAKAQAGGPPAGLSKEQFAQWMAQQGGG